MKNQTKKLIELLLAQEGYNQAQIAKETGISEGTVSRILKEEKYNTSHATHLKILNLAQRVAMIKEPKPSTEKKDGLPMDDECKRELATLKERISTLERYLLDMMSDSHSPFRRTPPRNRRAS